MSEDDARYYSAGLTIIAHSFEDLSAGRGHTKGDPRCMVCESEKWAPAQYRWQRVKVNKARTTMTIESITYEQYLMDIVVGMIHAAGGRPLR